MKLITIHLDSVGDIFTAGVNGHLLSTLLLWNVVERVWWNPANDLHPLSLGVVNCAFPTMFFEIFITEVS